MLRTKDRIPIADSSTNQSRTRVIVIGGGLAGLAAAAALAERGLSVTLLESRPRLGGRASSFVDSETGTVIDNCQHVSMGCCTNFHHFCDRLGLSQFLQTQKSLHFVGPDATVSQFAASHWPAPFHLMGAFRRLNYLSKRDLLEIRTALRALCRETKRTGGRQFSQWLREHGQSEQVMERFWHVVLVSALSESLDRIDLYHARKVFVDGFVANRHGWEVRIPVVPLDDLYGNQIARWFEKRNARLLLKTGATGFRTEGDRIVAVHLRDGSELAADHFVLAVPQHLVLPLLPGELSAGPQYAGVSRMQTAPISSVHLWFDREVIDLPHAVFVERTSQWMFNRTRLQNSGRDQRHYYQVVISASRGVTAKPQAETIADVVDELAAVWPEVRTAQLLHSRLVTEHRAVFSPFPGIEALRPPQQSPIPNLQIAGDWTSTGWPATMESAVRSGYLAAENILRQLDRPERLLQRDLSTALFARLLLRL